MSRTQPEKERWRLERQVTLGVIAAMTLQAAAALIWAGGAQERLAQLERRAAETRPFGERLARIEANTAQMRAALERIESRLEEEKRE